MKIIITGSEGLIGKELCKHLSKKNKILKLDLVLGHDLGNEKFVKKWFKDNKADALINCFAINDHIEKNNSKKNLFDIPLKQFSDYMDVNLTSLFSVCRQFAKNNKKGAIVNFSSTYGLVSPNPSLYSNFQKDVGYGVSKAGVINLTKFLAVHLAPNLRVNCVIPGGISFKQNSSFKKNYSKLTPMKRMMKKTELNGLIDYLCSKNSSYVTGSAITIDGGYLSL